MLIQRNGIPDNYRASHLIHHGLLFTVSIAVTVGIDITIIVVITVIAIVIVINVQQSFYAQLAQVILGQANRAQCGMKMRRNHLLIIETDQRNIIRNVQPTLTQGIIKAHGQAVIMAECRRRMRGKQRIRSAISAFLIADGRNDQRRIKIDTGIFQRIPITGKSADGIRHRARMLKIGDPPVSGFKQQLCGLATALTFVRNHRPEPMILIKTIDQNRIAR